jgi:hypothetical protein
MYGRYQSTSASSARNHAPQARVECEHETHGRRRDEDEQRQRHTGPEEHREEDSDEHHAAAEIRLQHDQQPWNADHHGRLPELEQGARCLASRAKLASEHENDGDLRELRWLSESMPSDDEPALGARRVTRASAELEQAE